MAPGLSVKALFRAVRVVHGPRLTTFPSVSSGVLPLLVAFAVQRRAHLILPVLLGLSMGCSGPRSAAKYAWLRKQGPVRMPQGLTATGPSAAAIPAKGVPPKGLFAGPMPDTFDPAPLASAAPSGTSFAAFSPAPTGPWPVPTDSMTSIRALDPGLAPLAVPAQDTTAYFAIEQHRWNAKAIASLPVAIGTVAVGIASQSIFILLAGGVVAFVLGLISARQCRDREDRGKGFALAAMILGGAAMFFSIMVIIWAA